MIQGLLRRLLLCLLLGAAFGASHIERPCPVLRVDTHLKCEQFLVLRAGFIYQYVGGLSHAPRLQQLLEGRFIVADCETTLEVASQPIQLWLENEVDNEFAGRIHAPVEEDGRDHGLKSVDQQGWLASAATSYLPAAEEQEFSELKLTSNFDQITGTHQVGAQFGELASLEVGKCLK